MARILVVEDSVDLARALRTNLELEGHEVGVALDGERGLALVRSSRPDLIVLDLMLPKMDGYLLLRAVRGEGLHMPVLILTARSDEAEKVRGFRWGADDYVTKPFSIDELRARVRALVRRNPGERPAVLTVGDLRLDPAARTVCRGSTAISLAAKEFAILEYFMRHPAQVISRARFLEHVWDFAGAGDSNIVDVYVRILRDKIDRPFATQSIETVRGAGYRLTS
jgi:two-component system OmpR family response regulator